MAENGGLRRSGDVLQTGIGHAGRVRRAPSGTVTFLLTDVEASTQAWQTDSAAAAAAIARQEEIVSGAIAGRGGFRPVEQGEGDSVVAAFARASDAVAAAVEAQLALAGERWPTDEPIRVRMALHTGEAEAHDGRYAGSTVIRTARLRAVTHGGQTVVSRATAELVGDTLPEPVFLVDLGSHRLRDLTRAEQIFQVSHPDLPATFPPLRSLDRFANNLPAQLTSFIGRETELAQVERLLAQVRLLTVTGAGGCGKTRLAAHAAAAVAESYPAGVWWVELASLPPGSVVSTAVLTALGLREQPSRSAIDQLADHFGAGRALLVLDNCEHVLDAVGGLVEPLLVRTPAVTVMATSREPLGVAGETTWRVPPLAVPTGSAPSTPEALTAFDAVALFVERARQARPNFTVTNDSAPTVAEICARLDGIPLAIELAAARVRVLSPQGIRAGLDDRFRLLTGGSKQGLARQQTLAASVEWSHDLLGEAERIMLRRLAVFAGGFTLDAAEAVCSGDGIEPLEVLDLLTGLVDKSLVVADDERPEPRYRLLETIRQFAAAHLDASGEGETVRDRHLGLQLQLAAAADVAFMADDALTARQQTEHDNLLLALDWALQRGRFDDALTLLVGLANLWLSRGLVREALAWFERVLGRADAAASSIAYRAVWARGLLAMIDGRPDPALSRADDVVEQARVAGDRRYVARGLLVQGTVQAMLEPAVGEKVLEGALAEADEVGDAITAVLGRVLLVVGALHRDDHPTVARHLDEGRDLLEGATGQMRSMYHALAGWSALRSGRFGEADRHVRSALELAAEIGDANLAGALAALTLALLELARGRSAEAAAAVEPVLREPRHAGPTREDAMLTGVWGVVLAEQGRLDEAEPVLAESVRLAEQIGDGIQSAFCLGWYAALLRVSGERQRARGAAEALRSHARQQGNPAFEALALRELGHLARLEGNLEAADDLAHAGLMLSAGMQMPPDLADHLDAVATVAVAEESYEEAARLFGAADALRHTVGSVPLAWDRIGRDGDLEAAGCALGSEAFSAAWAEGEALSTGDAVAYAQRGRGERKRPSSGWASLTPTERQVVDLLARGLRNAEIAERLFVAPSTVKTHLGHVFAKLGVSTRAELVALAARRS
jgi:predicted ATPase/class 3 adenylate cyclase/DNA-binding CsgD family transcriptional regulator